MHTPSLAAGLFFLHNPKAGGTSVSVWLAQQFSAEKRSPLVENGAVDHANLAGRYDDFKGYDFYSGHYGRDLFDAVRTTHLPVTNFRNPVSRLTSLYNYFRVAVPETEEVMTSPRFACVQAAKQQTFEAFLRNDDPRVSAYTRNHHTRQLTRSAWEWESDLAGAKALVDEMPWFYIAEEPDLSMAWATRWLGPGVANISRDNVTPDHAGKIGQISSDLEDLIFRFNQHDFALYEYALARMARLNGPAH